MTDSDHGPESAPQKATQGGNPSLPDLSSQGNPGNGDAAAPIATPTERPANEYLLMLAGVLIAVGVSFYWTFVDLIEIWEVDPNYSHGYVVPFFALGLGWVAWTRHQVMPVANEVARKDTIRGAVEIVIGFAMHIAGRYLAIDILDVVGLIFVLLGILLAFGGEKANKVYGLPVFFLIFMAPIPDAVYGPTARVLQNFASIVTVALFDVVGIPATRSGIWIDIPGPHDMEVGAACSGLRSLTAILALAVAIAYLSGRGMKYRAILVMMAAPVAVAVNCLRVFGTGLIMLYIGPEWATGVHHERQGMVMVGVAAGILALIAWVMAGLEDWYQERREANRQQRGTETESSLQPALDSN